ncbi:MAG: hypothetical protein QOJ72_2654 [Nocardioidaceae bacterium]|nr:hypothetical protein [Nocardioidaceae bacterium]
MTDVAKLAGVSHQTVSRVINDHPSVRSDTRARVRAAMQELGYRPNNAARALVTGRTRVVGVVAQNTALFGPASMLTALERALDSAGLAVGIASVQELDQGSIGQAVERLLEQRVGGIVVIAPVASANEAIDDLPADLPFVAIDGDPQRPHQVVTVDQALGARLATQHLLAAGHETVWHVSGPDDWFDSARRVDGWREALREAGVEEPPVIRADWTLAAGHAAGRMLANMPTVTAVFAANDHLAIGIMKALSEAGRRVPEDLSIVGFDDIPESAYLSPALTTIRPDFNAVAGEAVSMLMSQMAGGTDSPPLTVDAIAPTLVERDSVRVV